MRYFSKNNFFVNAANDAKIDNVTGTITSEPIQVSGLKGISINVFGTSLTNTTVQGSNDITDSDSWAALDSESTDFPYLKSLPDPDFTHLRIVLNNGAGVTAIYNTIE